MPDVVHALFAHETVAEKLGRRGISTAEAQQLLDNHHVILRNPRARRLSDRRRLMVGETDGGRSLTLVIERTLEPTDWLVVTGWDSAPHERRMRWR